MTQTIVSLLSIVFGIFGANFFAALYNKFSFGFTGNTILGVFGSILFIKSIGRLGLSPNFVVVDGQMSLPLLLGNLLLSFCGGIFFLFAVYFLKKRFDRA